MMMFIIILESLTEFTALKRSVLLRNVPRGLSPLRNYTTLKRHRHATTTGQGLSPLRNYTTRSNKLLAKSPALTGPHVGAIKDLERDLFLLPLSWQNEMEKLSKIVYHIVYNMTIPSD